MRIATWNIERLKHRRQLPEITNICNALHADILVLTETDERVQPDYPYCFKTAPLAYPEYRPTENRVTIYSKYPCIGRHETCDGNTSVCVELETDKGALLVYGTIIGVYGNRNAEYPEALNARIKDIERLSELGELCVAGDYNQSFADSCYYTKNGRSALLRCFSENDILLLTRGQPECIDHIAISAGFADFSAVLVEKWNIDRSLSDHKGIMVGF